ncbi:hypothetical protein MJO28_015124 [Puccinia striiformis f. sp. tritici]|uniref:Cyclin-like domain-containing protein n=3 Tax=Puccinia striiformis TaxID=27350 RepID=A0A0L0UW72_9BASI|nr:hypothetical protein MJO29_014893 [Puccinia striiformis f. sp. tritici]KAI7938204.1 hypothetical protein MJO28_015124 [Puccinia striiformis f. sp. tritici]KAI9616081.1 hypothetical protein KEM48_005338 [Puccinia striiformis f. sp. tritici PST-130]KNE91303.1 hypothetical protein PSTG_15285 [Puccinia striiformis f. sp. tritici PST-78]POW22013.1 hypothetical protein PSHT_01789 [Puccinia striiformis]
MAANYWLSSHANCHILTRHDLRNSPGRSIDLKYAGEREIGCINIWSSNVIHKIGKRLNCRQIVTATAVTYFRRFYVKNAICETDPCLVAAAAMYVATKVEEAPSHIKTVLEASRSVFSDYPTLGPFPNDATILAEMEFYLIEDLDFHLMIWHPYRDLAQFAGREDSAIPKDALERISEWTPPTNSPLYLEYRKECDRQSSMLDLSDTTLQTAWFIINDTYRTDLILLYPPYIIALAAIYITVVLHPHPSFQAMKPIAPPPIRGTIEETGPSTRARRQSTNPAPVVPGGTVEGTTPTTTTTDSPGKPTKVVPLDFFARFPISMSLVLELVQEIVASYELWNRLENPTLSIHRAPEEPSKISRGLASTRLNRPIYGLTSDPSSTISSINSSNLSPSINASSATKASGDKAADERVVDILIRMRKARELDQA